MAAVETHPVTAELVRTRLRGKRVDVAGTIFKSLLLVALTLSVLVLAVLLFDVVTGSVSVFSERAGDFLDQKTGSAHKERIDTAQEFADKHLGEK